MFRSFALGGRIAFVSLSTLLCTLFFYYQLTETDNTWLPATPVTPTRVLGSTIAVPSHKSSHPNGQHGDLMDEPISLPDDVLYSKDSNEGGAQAWRAPSENAFRRLRSCLRDRTCTENQQKVVLVDSMYFRNCLRGDVGGEEIWARSTLAALRNLGYTVLLSENTLETVQVYQLLPDLVKIVILDDWDTFNCWKDKQNCLRSEQNPRGIPGYKLLSFYFWPFPRHPLGPRWILSPELYALHSRAEATSNNTYLGYSIEEACALTPFIPASERPSAPQRAWILAKLLWYFVTDEAWSKGDLDALAEDAGVRFAMAARYSVAEPTEEEKALVQAGLPDAAHYENYVSMGQAEFMEKLGQSRVVIGMGKPLISPTPWNALCLGVPFINVVFSWDPQNPDDSTRWRSQHATAALLPKPYVYNVRKGDREGLIQAVKEALGNPIESYIPEWMRMSSIEERLAEIVDTDWEEAEREQAKWCNRPCGCQEPCDAGNFGIDSVS